MQRFATYAMVTAFGALFLGTAPGLASSSVPFADQNVQLTAATDISAQTRTEPVRRRARTQLRVYPRYPRRTFHTFYPLPYPVEYPGPNAVRHCVSNLVPEYRPSGTVIVPRMRCWWARG